MHNAAYAALGLAYTYVALETEDTVQAIALARNLRMHGLSIGVPHKTRVREYLHEVDSIAKTIGAVNSVVNDCDRLTGFNLDWVGATGALQEQTKIEGKRAVVVGAGGAAKAIVYALLKAGAKATVFNRSLAKAHELCQNLGATMGGDLSDLHSVGDYDILINATSVGFFNEQESAVPPEAIRSQTIIFDVIFSPLHTKLVRLAEERNCTVITGERMLVHVAAAQFALYTGKDAPLNVMEQALREGLDEQVKRRSLK